MIGLILSLMLFVFSTPADTDNSQSYIVVGVIDSVKHPGQFNGNLSSLTMLFQ